jgi:hypothetical protein
MKRIKEQSLLELGYSRSAPIIPKRLVKIQGFVPIVIGTDQDSSLVSRSSQTQQYTGGQTGEEQADE